MSHKINTFSIIVCCLITATLAAVANADTYVQDFDGWATERTVFGTWDDDGWRVHDGVVRQAAPPFAWPYSAYSDPYMCALNATNGRPSLPFVRSTVLSNGAGIVSFYYRTKWGSPDIAFEVHSSTNGGAAWATNASLSEATQTWTYFETNINVYGSNTLIRLQKTADPGRTDDYLFFEDINITLPYAYADISDVQLAPSPPLTETPLVISAKIVPRVYGSNLVAAARYSTNNWVTSASAGMTETGGNYWVTSPGIPAMSTPGLTVQYYIDVELDGPTINNTHSYWPVGAPSTTDSYILRARSFASSYTNMSITGPPSTNMSLTSDYVWRGVTVAGSFTDPTFYFGSGGSTWGDTNQSESNAPISGVAEPGGTILVSGHITNHLEFTFNETPTNLSYSVQLCEYVYFDDWSGAEAFGTRSNPENWRMENAQTTSETNKAFGGAGLSCVLQGGSAGSIRSPDMPTGLGTINFRYRNWQDNGSVAGSLAIEKSATGSAPWIPVTDIGGILTPDYVYVSIGVADDVNRYVRIVNTSSNTTDYMLLDNISASPPGALVMLSNGTNTLAPSEAGQSVPVQVSYSTSGGATNLECRVFWKSVDATEYTSLTMTDEGGIFNGIIPPTLAGTVEYYFECTFDGFNAASVRYPDGGQSSPLTFTAVDTVPAYRFQNFDSWTPLQTEFGTYTYNQWIVSNGVIRAASFPFAWPFGAYSSPNMAALNAPLADGAFPRYSVTSPSLTGGCSAVSFYYRTKFATPSCTFEVQTSTDNGATWKTKATISDSTLNWTNSAIDLDVFGDALVRIEKTGDGNTTDQFLLLEDIACPPPSSDISITNVFLSPGYPGTADTVTVYCDIYSKDPSFMAFDFKPKIVYRAHGDSWITNSMSLVSGDNRTNTYSSTIPPQNPDTVEYFFRCDFAGYYYTNSNVSTKRSPAFLPDAPATTNMPSTYFEYVPRRYLSDYNSLSVSSSVGNVSMSLVGDNYWQGIFKDVQSTQLLINFSALGYFTGSAYSSETNFWGDDSQDLFDTPLSGTATQGASSIVININTSSLSQVLILFNSRTGYYEVRRGAYEDFDEWRADPNYFANSLNIANIIVITNDFNSWPTNAVVTRPAPLNQGLADFQDPQWSLFYTSGYEPTAIDPFNTVAVNDRFWIEEFRIVYEVGTNYAAEFNPRVDADYGATWPDEANLMDGLGNLEWRARCRLTDHYVTIYTNSYNWTNYAVKATLRGSDAAGNPKLTLLAYYQNPSNYYECSIIGTNNATDMTRYNLWLYRVINGSRSLLNFLPNTSGNHTDRNGFPDGSFDITFKVSSADNRVRLEASATTPGGDSSNLLYTDLNTNLIAGGAIGLHPDDIAISASSISAYKFFYRSFDGWNSGPSYTTIATNDNWTFQHFRTDNNYCWLSNNVDAAIITPYLAAPATTLKFRVDWETLAATNCRIEGSYDKSSWTSITNFSVSSGENDKTVSTGLDTYNYLRLLNNEGTGFLRINWIYVETAGTSFYTEPFTNPATGTPTGWQDASGYWNVNSGTYNRQAYCGSPLNFRVDVNTNYADPYPLSGWTEGVGHYTVTGHQYQAFSTNFQYWGKLFPRIVHSGGDGKSALRVDDIRMSSWRAQNFETNGWAVTEGWTTKVADGNNKIELWRSKANPTNAQAVRSPKMTNGVGSIEFDYDFTGLSGSNATFDIEYGYNTNTAFLVTNTYTVTLSDALPGKVFFDFSTSEQIYVRVRHTTPNNTAIMKIDNLEITDYKARDDRTWEAYNAKITSLEDTREFEPFVTNSQVKTAFLNLNASSNTLNGAVYSTSVPFIQSSIVTEGIGRVSFWYRAWEDDGDPAGTIRLYAAASASESTTNLGAPIAEIASVDNTEYRLYQNEFNIKDKYYLRLTSGTNGQGRVCIDNMLVAQPFGADFSVQLIEVTPNVPLNTDTVQIAAEIGRFIMSPSNIQAKAYYHIGTNNWGNYDGQWNTNANFLSLSKVTTNGNVVRFETADLDDFISAQDIDTVVQYYVEFTFDGTHAKSPKQGRTFTNPSWYSNINLNADVPDTNRVPYYIVYSCPPDTVWINEFNYDTWDGGDVDDFIEIAGKAGSQIRNWRIELLNSGYTKYGDYSITNITTLTNDINGFGFWVLGVPTLSPSPDMTFTNVPPFPFEEGGIRLVRSSGIIEDAIAYGVAMTGFTYSVGSDTKITPNSARLIGTGEVSSAFTWTVDGVGVHSANAENEGQTLELASPPAPTYTITISNFWTTSSNTWIISVSDHSNQIAITPWYTTNLINTNWVAVPIFSQVPYTPLSGVYSQYFDNLTNPPPVYFRVTSTNDP